MLFNVHVSKLIINIISLTELYYVLIQQPFPCKKIKLLWILYYDNYILKQAISKQTTLRSGKNGIVAKVEIAHHKNK